MAATDAAVAGARLRDAGVRMIDAAMMIAPPIDAGMIDAAVMIAPPIDARIDARIDAPPAPARVTFVFDTWCELVVGDMKRGRADRALVVELEAGRHRATCSQGPGLETWSGTVDVEAGETKRVEGTLIEPVDVLVDVGDAVRIDDREIKRGERVKLKPGRRRVEVLVGGKARPHVYVSIPRVERCTLREKPQLDCYR